jgi:release factor glutamine methyltransferase
MTMLAAAETVGTATRRLAAELAAAGIDTAGLDARLLVGHALGLTREQLVLRHERTLSRDEAKRIAVLAGRRLAGEPVARIVGEKEFYGLAFALNAATLVPRPETETLVEAVLERLRRADAPTSPLIVDLGTGTGAIAISLLKALPRAHAVATDRSPAALGMAWTNARRHGVVDRLRLVVGDFSAMIGRGVDALVSNPPYIRSAHIDGLAREVRCHDPRLALDGGVDGLDAYRRIIADADRILAPNGAVFLEVGAGQSEAVAAIGTDAGLNCIGFRRDLSGVERVVMFNGTGERDVCKNALGNRSRSG